MDTLARHKWIMLLFLLYLATDLVLGRTSKLKPKPGKNKNRDRERGTTGGSSSSSGKNNNDNNDNVGHGGDILNYRYRQPSNEERLLGFLFYDYDEVARGCMNTSETVGVSIEFVLLRIHGLDERSQVLTTTGLIIAEWQDDRLTWEPEQFGGLEDIIVKSDRLWLPELAVMNGAEELIPDYDRIRVLLNYNGTLHWEPGGIFRTTCDIDITYFPFDTQHCPIFIGAYSYYSSKMNISNNSDIISMHDFQPNGEWHIAGTAAVWNITVLQCCPGIGYTHVVFTLHLKRRSQFYIVNIVLPCLMLSVLIMIGFFLPPDAGEKISLGISVLLAFTVFLLMIADNIPRTSLAIPLMVVYLTATMLLGTVSICMTVIVLNVHHRAPRFPVPKWIKCFMLYYMAKLLCIRTHYITKQAEKVYATRLSNRNNTNHNNKTNHQNNGILDEMETMGLTAVLTTRQTNGPSSLTMRNSHDSQLATVLNSENNSIRNRLSRWTKRLSKHKVIQLEVEEEEEEPDYSRDWHEFAQVLDRVFFWVLFLLMTVSAIFILLYPKYSGIEAAIADRI